MGDWKEYVRQNYVPGKYGTTRLAKDTGVSRIAIRTFLYKEGIIEEPERDAPIHKPAAQKPAQPQTDASATIIETPPAGTSGLLLNILRKGASIESIASRISAPESVVRAYIEDFKQKGYNLSEYGTQIILDRAINLSTHHIHKHNWKGERTITFAAIGDTHFNSTDAQYTYLKQFYKTCKARNVSRVLHTGDLDDGNMRLGAEYEVECTSLTQHVANIVRRYPYEPGVETEVIGGNHDFSWHKKAGADIVRMVSLERPDIRHLGNGQASVWITPNCRILLKHPGGGGAQRLSLKPQKIIDAMSAKARPDIALIGHTHKAEMLPMYKGVYCFQTGTFQAQTGFMMDNDLAAMMGGWIINAEVDDEGRLIGVGGTFYGFPDPIEDDYLNFERR